MFQNFQRIIQEFESEKQENITFLEIEIDTVSKKILDHKFAEYLLPDKYNDGKGKNIGEFKLIEKDNIRYVWEGEYWTKIIDHENGEYSAIIFSNVDNRIIGNISWNKDNSLQDIENKLKIGKQNADYIAKISLFYPILLDLTPNFGTTKYLTRAKKN